ncbi:biotin-dependent carboxyltransferase family protein [Bacillus sp. FJAT-27245]|uniref:5-oxoprolinase subunit C family protein n=1 Tax=Bacillus sp. FJAT-27245 TaxID=1684144 RepID=UPI0006A7DEF5|nr:biotin-dependent carboxyltransferase family protein [Bacillus sp. FJAT-27245]
MAIPVFEVLRAGLQATVQDSGRPGWQRFGVSPSGAMDWFSMHTANILVGNPPGEAVLETVFPGPVLELLSDCTVAICGGNLSPRLDGKPAPLWKSFRARKGQLLSFGKPVSGARAYIAVSGGIDVPAVLGSRSTYLAGGFGGLEGRSLRKGDVLSSAAPISGTPGRGLASRLVPAYSTEITVRAIPGPHTAAFEKESLETFFTKSYSVSPNSNRMGLSLNGPKLLHREGADILSDAVPLGGIQVPSGGQPIILMAERQPTGGYTRIGTVITADLPLLAQAMPGSTVRFRQAGVEEAQKAYMETRAILVGLAIAAGAWHPGMKLF